MHRLPSVIDGVSAIQSVLVSAYISNVYTNEPRWDGWRSNPRPADYEKPVPALRALCLHRYHEDLPPIAQIAPLARVTRSTSRSTPDHGDRQILATERYLRRTPPRGPARFILLLDVRGGALG
jgi:hypothetical protein